MTRHSIREEATGHFAHYKLPLTKEGRELAQYWGSLLPPIGKLYCSPVERCIDTAKCMLVENRLKSDLLPELVIDKGLTEPGCFLIDRKEMMAVSSVFQSKGPEYFVGRLLAGDFSEVGSASHRVHAMLGMIESRAGECGTLSLHVTHDTVIAAFVYTLLEQFEISKSDWPRMMEGLFCWFDEDDFCWVWRGERYQMNKAALFSRLLA